MRERVPNGPPSGFRDLVEPLTTRLFDDPAAFVETVRSDPFFEQPADTSFRRAVAIGSAARPAAQVYADLMDGEVVQAKPSERFDPAGVRAVFVSYTDLGPDLMEVVYSDGGAPGIFCGDDEEAILVNLATSMAALIGAPTVEGGVEVYPTQDFRRHETGRRLMLGAGAEREVIIDKAASGHDVLSWYTHSNGLDVLMGRQLAMCDIEWLRSRVASAQPYCVITGKCFRFGTLIDEAVTSGRIIAPPHLAARVLVLAVCSGVLPPDGPLPNDWGFLRRVLANHRVGAVLTTWSVQAPTIRDVAALLDLIYSGCTLGECVAEVNQHESDFNLCIFGEPTLRVRRSGLTLDQLRAAGAATLCSRREKEHRSSVARPVPLEQTSQVGFMRAYLFNAVTNADGSIATAGEKALRSAQLYEHALGLGEPVEGATAIGPALREHFIEFLRLRGSTISHDWLPLTIDKTLENRAPCPHCSLPLRDYVFRFRTEQFAPRRLITCARCGGIADVPASANAFRVRVTEEGRVELWADRVRHPWLAALHLGCQDDAVNHVEYWPADRRGNPIRAVTPASWPPGPLKVSVILLQGVEISVVTCFAREPDRAGGARRHCGGWDVEERAGL